MNRTKVVAKLGAGPAHERLILATLATSLFEHSAITTTEAKAQRLRPLAERLITFAQRGDLHSLRRVRTVIRDRAVVERLFTEIAPAMASDDTSRVRVTTIGGREVQRRMAVVELVLVTPDGGPNPVPEVANAVQHRVLGEFTASSRDEVVEVATQFELLVRGYARSDAGVVATRPLAVESTGPVLLRIVRLDGGRREAYRVQVSWIGETPTLPSSVEGAAEKLFGGGSSSTTPDPG